MTKVSVETKNGGTIQVPVFDSIEDVIKAVGKEKTLNIINRMVRVDAVNEANRKQSLISKLRRAKKEGVVSDELIQELLEKAYARKS